MTRLTSVEAIHARRLSLLREEQLTAAAVLAASVRDEVELRRGPGAGARLLLIVAEGVRLWALSRR